MVRDDLWRSYEREVHGELAAIYRGRAKLRCDVRLPGHLSGRKRQIDVLIEEGSNEQPLLTVVDAKHRRHPIDVNEVEAFIGLLKDVGVVRGIMVTSTGYSKAALTRAHRDEADLDLDILTLEEYRQWQGAGGIPYAGPNGAIVSAPFGWVLDCQRFQGVLARFYQLGLTFEAAALRKEWAYLNIWHRKPPIDNLDLLLRHQESNIREFDGDAVISIRDVPSPRFAERACIRRMETLRYPTAEITGFAEFPHFILFVVLFTPLLVERRNTRKVEHILASALPLGVRHTSAA